MQADNSVAYQYLLCTVQCNRLGALDVSSNSLTGAQDYTRVKVAQIESVTGSMYNCYAASSMAAACTGAQDMVDKHPLSANERVVLCKIKQQSTMAQPAASAPVLLQSALLPSGVSGQLGPGPAALYKYTVHRHASVGDRITSALSRATDPAPYVTLPNLSGPYFAHSLEEARAIASRLETADKLHTVAISRIESSATESVPVVALDPVSAQGMPADNSRHYAYLLLRCVVQRDGRLDVSTRSPEPIVRAAVVSCVGGTTTRNMMFVRDAASLHKAIAMEKAHASLAYTQRVLVCKIKCLSEMAVATVPALRTENASYRYMVHRHDVNASGALTIQTAPTSSEHWSRLRGNGMYMAETADDANRIVAQLCVAEQRAGNSVSDQMWLVSRVESVLSRAPLVFVPVPVPVAVGV